jgi:hypothetical protein
MPSIQENFFSILRARNNRLQFDEVAHKYWIPNYEHKPFRSVSQIISLFKPPFPLHTMAEAVAEKYAIPPEEVMAAWSRVNRKSVFEGKSLHSFAEYHSRGEVWHDSHIEAGTRYWKLKNSFLEYWQKEMNGTLVLLPEIKLYTAKFWVAGTADKIYQVGDRIVIRDYKTNKEFHNYKKSKRFQPPLNHVPGDHIHEYSLQLWLYNLMLRQATKRMADVLEMVSITEDGYEIIEAANMEREAAWVLRHWREHDKKKEDENDENIRD